VKTQKRKKATEDYGEEDEEEEDEEDEEDEYDEYDEDEVEEVEEVAQETTPPETENTEADGCTQSCPYGNSPESAEPEEGIGVMMQGYDITLDVPLATMKDPPYGTSIQWTEQQLDRYNNSTAHTNYVTGKHFLRLKKACHFEIHSP
jgi:hypothetical protein